MTIASVYIQEKSLEKNGWCKTMLSFYYKASCVELIFN